MLTLTRTIISWLGHCIYLECMVNVFVALSFEGATGVLSWELMNQWRGASEAQDLRCGKFRLPVKENEKVNLPNTRSFRHLLPLNMHTVSQYKPVVGESRQVSVYKIAEGEVGLIKKVVLQVRVRYLGAMLSEGFQSHKLHHSFGQVAHQPLL